MSIRYKILLILLLLAFSTLSIISSVYYFYSQKSVKEEAIRNLEAMANVQHNRLKNFVENNHEKLRLINSRTQLRISLKRYNESGDEKAADMIHRIISDALAHTESIDDILVMDREGRVVRSVLGKTDGLSYAERPFFSSARDALFACILHDKKQLAYPDIIFSAPLLIDKEFIGVIAIQVSIDHLNDFLQDYTGLGTTGEVVMALKNENGDLLYFSPLRFSHSPMLVPKASTAATPMQAALSHKEQLFEDALDYRGKHVIAFSRYLDALDIGIVVKVDRDELLEISYELRILILQLVILLIIIVVATSVYLAKKITKPVLDITDVAVLISHGDFEKRVHAMTQDELGELANALNEMADRLIHSNKLLEEKVKERTAQLRTMNMELEKISMTDPLTGIANRRKFTAHLDQEWRRSMRDETPLSLLMIDADFFKSVNDTLGHQTGDRYLQAIAHVLTERIHRPGDLAARFGGEEFTVILEHTPAESARSIAESIREAVENLRLEHPKSAISPYLTVSIGVATHTPEREEACERLIRDADSALYRAKKGGRNRIDTAS